MRLYAKLDTFGPSVPTQAKLDRHLASNEYFGGDYSIADMTMYSDVHLHGVKDIGLKDYSHVKRWHDAIEARPAVQRAWGPFPT